MNCNFIKDGSCLICTNCGFKICNIDGPVYRNCTEEKDTSKSGLRDKLKDLKQAGKDIATGNFTNSEERLKICQDCEHYTNLGRCNLCGCFMKLKTKLKNSKCPINKW